MGEIDSIQRLITGAGMSPADIQRIVAPPVADRNRSAQLGESDLIRPPIVPWRLETPVGAALVAGDVIRANFFQVNTDRVPSSIFKYAVHMYSINADGSDKEEVSQREDERITTSLMAKLRTRHNSAWSNIGFGYDGRSMLMTSHSLLLPDQNPDGQPFLSEMIGLPSRATGNCYILLCHFLLCIF